MEHLHSPVDAEAGDTIEVTIDGAANVLLLSPAEYDNYRNGRPYRYDGGGYATVTPVNLDVPATGRWHVVVDLGGGPGHVRASVARLTGSPA